MNIILYDALSRNSLMPLTLTRPVADIRVGIMTIREKWEAYLNKKTSTATLPYLQEKFPAVVEDDNLLIDGTLIPTPSLLKEIMAMSPSTSLVWKENIIAARVSKKELALFLESYSNENGKENGPLLSNRQLLPENTPVRLISHLTDIYTLNKEEIQADFEQLVKDRQSCEIPNNNLIIGNKEDIFVEENVEIEGATLNAKEGPIYIAKNAKIMEGSVLRGPLSIGESVVIKVGSKIYGETTIGPYCKVGGEIQNVVFFGFSNKAHDGYLGNSVIGEWCNLGADTNSSNLQNNYRTVKQWSYPAQNFVDTGLQFCGLVMGDHSRCSINTMFNTGTVIGVNCNLFGAGFHQKIVPSFSYGGNETGYSDYLFAKAKETAETVFKRRGLEFDEKECRILEFIANKKKEYHF